MAATMDIGVIGLGVMGRNLALNFADHGYGVAAFDLDESQSADAGQDFPGKHMAVARDLAAFVQQLKSPRKVMPMVPAGAPVDAVIQDLKPLLDCGDIIIDGGNSNFGDTNRRVEETGNSGLLFIGTGVSGGEKGARKGPSIMPGGHKEAWEHVRPLLQSISAKMRDEPCCDWVGDGGSGHYVKRSTMALNTAICSSSVKRTSS